MRAARAVVLLATLSTATAGAGGKVYPCRWVYVSRGLRTAAQVAEIGQIVRTAADHGLNGMVLSAGLDRLDLQPREYFRGLEAVKAACAKHKVEIIPIIFSAGYGGAVLGHDRNLAAGIPVRDVPFVVRGGKARLVPDGGVRIANGGFEEFRGHRMTRWRFHDRPGQVSFADTKVFKQGRASLRFEAAATDRHGHARVMQEVAVEPHRCYRVTCWVKTDGLEPADRFAIQAIAQGRTIAPVRPRLPSTGDWRKVTVGFNSLTYRKVGIYAGCWKAKRGRFWVDDMRIEEVALANVLRRPGAPLSVRGEATGLVYEEDRDFAPIADPKLNFRFDHDGPPITLLAGSRIKEGERLRVSYYHGVAINRSQVSVCMSEPKLYDIWRAQARLIHKHLAPRRYLLSMDEIRAGGSCQACRRRGLSMGQILGDCITKQFNILREVNPKAEILVWSDMLDPHHNARGNYYLVEGDFTGSWKHVPEDLVIVCWYHKLRDKSLKHFSDLGFKTLAGAYYDADDLENPKGWLDSLDRTPGAIGIMYTTWRNKYKLLAPFGDLVSHR